MIIKKRIQNVKSAAATKPVVKEELVEIIKEELNEETPSLWEEEFEKLNIELED